MTLAPLPVQPADVPWPTTEWPTGDVAVADRARLDALIDRCFEEPGPDDLGHTHALLVVQGGRLVLERYGNRFVSELHALAGVEPGPITATDPLISWSMAKSVMHVLVGMLALDGKLDLADHPPVPGWTAGDPRAAITWDHLLQMRPGLQWVEEYYEVSPDAIPDVITMLYTAAAKDMAAFAAGFPLVHEPGSPEAYTYSSGTTNIVSAAAGRIVGGGEAGMRTFLQDRLFGPLGMTSATPTFDEAGTFVASSYLDATARDFARFGLFALRDGTWEGERLLPEGWIDHGRTPRSPDENLIHGAHWWQPKDARWGTFAAHGFEGQRIYCVPDLDLVLVRLGRTVGDAGVTLSRHLTEVISQFA